MTSDQSPVVFTPTPYDEIDRVLFRTVLQKAQQYPVQECRDFLSFLKKIRWYGISSSGEIQSIWHQIRENEWITDFVMDVVVDFDLQLRINGMVELTFIGEQLGKSIDALKVDNSPIMDFEFTARKPTETMCVLMKTYTWLTVCFLMSRIDLKSINIVMDAMNKAITPKQ